MLTPLFEVALSTGIEQLGKIALHCCERSRNFRGKKSSGGCSQAGLQDFS
jgi:hypothetical protein